MAFDIPLTKRMFPGVFNAANVSVAQIAKEIWRPSLTRFSPGADPSKNNEACFCLGN